VKAALDREGVVASWGGRFWSLKYIRNRINDDVYRLHPSRIREELAVRHALTTVRMRAFGEEELEAYARLGEGVGKAGGYAIQGRAAGFVEWIGGDYTNVVGLPLALTVRMLAGFGLNWY
jgi:predicted house-cleaning NTP pyrophosphatase (Maf/HAM1 superfamily)